MYDPIVRELFPELQPLNMPQSVPPISSEELNSAFPVSRFNKSSDFHASMENYFRGKYKLSDTLSHFGEYYFPSSNTRRTFLYLQLLCSATFGKEHYTCREDLASYLMALTFYGKGSLNYEGKNYLLSEGDVFLIDCRKKHEYQAVDGQWGYRIIHFDGAAMPGYYRQVLHSGNVRFHFEDGSRFMDLFRELLRASAERSRNEEIIENRILTDMIMEILCELPQFQDTALPPEIMNQCNYLQEHCCEKLSLDQLSAQFGLSKYYMCREFKKHTGETIFSYITDCRIAVAQRLLRYTDMPVCDIAEHVGFEDHNGFYRAFRGKEDISPTEYRRLWSSL